MVHFEAAVPLPSAPKPLRVDSDADILTCERIIAECAEHPGDRPLVLATNWDIDSRPGGAAAAAQMLVSWARSASLPTLVTYATCRDDAEAIVNFSSRLHGVIGAMMAAKILTQDKATDISHEVYAQVRKRVEAMDRLDIRAIRRGQAVSLVCIDHSSFRALRPFYHHSLQGEPIRSLSEFRVLVGQLVSAAAPSYVASLKPNFEDLAILLYELFTNTHVHARTNPTNVSYKRSVRGVVMAQRTVPRDKLLTFSMSAGDLHAYLTNVNSYATRSTIKLLELSVFDSGPGLAQRMSGRSLDDTLSIAEEYGLVQRCFLKHVTSRTEPGLGMGLPRVMRVLKERGGLLRLRTGRLALARFFDPGQNLNGRDLEDSDLNLLDAETLSDRLVEKGRAAGTAVTILIPVGLDLS